MNAKRGFVPEDVRDFSPDAVKLLRKASRHVCYLIEEGYDLKQAATFVGNHFMLSERQRLAIMRSVATKQRINDRKSRQAFVDEIAGKEVWIDGFNTIITLEVMLSKSLIFSCMDGTLRDLAALRGTYRLISETEKAIRMMLDVLQTAAVRSVVVLLDEPVSNSGRLKTLMAEIGEVYGFDLDIQICRDVDRNLYNRELVITSDSVILDRCASWINLTEECEKRTDVDTIRVWE